MVAPGRAAYDEFGSGFTLIAFGATDDEHDGVRAFAAAAGRRNLPLKILHCVAPDGLYDKKFVLVRPDHHIAWHGDAVPDPLAVIDRARGAGAT
jgi:hypothetical protein